VIRYYPGPGAKRSISHIKSLLSGRRGLVPVESEAGEANKAKPAIDDRAEALILKMISEYGLIEKIARQLVEENIEEAHKQVEAFPYRKAKPDNPAAFLVQSIREKWPLPEKYLAMMARRENDTVAHTQTENERMAALLTEVIECLQQAMTHITTSEKPALYESCCGAERELGELRDGIVASNEGLLGEVENRLTAAEDRITTALWQSTDPENLEAMLKSARAELQKYEATMEPKVFSNTLRQHVTARLREQHRIPRLSLFYL